MEPASNRKGDETATRVSEYVQISQGGKLAATSIPWSLVMALQAVRLGGRENQRFLGLNPSHSVILKDSYLPLIRYDLYPVDN